MYSQGCDPDNKKSRKKGQIYGGLRVKYDITCDQITATKKKDVDVLFSNPLKYQDKKKNHIPVQQPLQQSTCEF